jgi:hypothetical protein
MALVQYSDLYWFPDGTLAANEPARVFPHHSNILAPLFTDITGGTPLPNPLNTDGAGVLTFWAEEGKYWVHMDSEAFLIDVGLSEEEADLTTGVASGGEMNIAGPTSVEITALVGYVVDNNNLLSVSPTVIKVDEPTQTVALDAGSLARASTTWLMDSAGNVIQQAAAVTQVQRRTHLALGVTIFDTVTQTLIEAQTRPIILGQPVNQTADVMDALGPLSTSGNTISANGANLGFNKAAGTLFIRASNHFAAGVLTDNPHFSPSPGFTPVTFRRILRTPIVITPPAVAVLDPANYDLSGVLTPVGGGTNTATVQRVWAFVTNDTTTQILVQYGQSTYTSLANAVASIGHGNFVPNPVTVRGALIGWICVIRTATNLSDPTQAVFVRAGKFPTP